MQGLQRATPHPQQAQTIPLAVQHLQSGEERGIQLQQAVVPHVQVGHVTQEVRLLRHHLADPVEPGAVGGVKRVKGQLPQPSL